MTRKDTCTPMFTEALYTKPGHGNNPNVHWQRSGSRRCSTYTQWNITQPLKGKNNGICSNMDGPRNYNAKWSQSDNETPTSNAFTDMWNLKKRTDWMSLQNRCWLTDIEKLMVSRGDRLAGGGMCLGCGMEILWNWIVMIIIQLQMWEIHLSN